MSTAGRAREFSGQWITNDRFCALSPRNVFHRQLDASASVPRDPELENRHVLFRSWFTLERPEKALVYITADDYYKLYINGSFVTQGPAPGYADHYYYNTVDISAYVTSGQSSCVPGTILSN